MVQDTVTSQQFIYIIYQMVSFPMTLNDP